MTVTWNDKLLGAASLRQPMPAALRDRLARQGRPLAMAAGATVFRPGSELDFFAVVVEGSIRVFKESENGREITLYSVDAGECCMINVLCLLTDRPSPATARTDTAVQALTYSAAAFREWFAEFEVFRSLVLGQFANRVDAVMALVEEVAFRRMDRRLADYLADRVDRQGGTRLAVTHEAVAADLGTAREVISRLLKSFAAAGAVELGRGCITVLDPEGLRRAGG